MSVRNRGLPVWMTGETYARATLAGADLGKSVDQFVEWATLQAITVHERQLRAAQPAEPPRPAKSPRSGKTPGAIFGTSEAFPGMRSNQGKPAASTKHQSSLARKSEPGGPGGRRQAPPGGSSKRGAGGGNAMPEPPPEDRWGPPQGEEPPHQHPSHFVQGADAGPTSRPKPRTPN